MDALEFNKIKLLHEQVESLTKSGTWELDLKKNKLSWSDGVFRMLGYQPQEFEVTFEKGVEVIHPQDRERATALMENVLQNNVEYIIEKKLLTKTGNIIHVRTKANVFKDDQGTPIKLIGVFQDISDFVKSQEQVVEQNVLTQDIIRNLPSAFYLFNEKGEHLLWNKQLEEITGYNHKEIASLTPLDLYEGEEVEKIKYHINEVLEKGYTEVEAWLSTKNNGKVPLFFTASIIQYKGERCVFGTGTDISKRLSLLHELELLISNTDEAFIYIDQELNVISFNNQMKSHYSLLFNKELKKGLKLTHLAKKNQKEDLNHIINQVWMKQQAKAILHANSDDQKKYFELKFKPILSDDNKVDGIFITSLDITETHTIHTALKKSKQKLQQVLDSSLDTLCTIDENGIFQMVSRSSEKLWGYKPEELVGKPFMDFVVEEDKALTTQVAKEIREGKQYRNFENHYRHKNGEIVPVVWSAYWEEEQNLMNCVARDATDKLQEEEQLKFSEGRFKSLVQQGGDLIAILDLEGKYKYVSPTSTSILGIKPEEFIGNNAFDFIHPDDKEWAVKEFEKLEKENHIVLPPFRFKNKKGNWRWLESQISNLFDEPSVQGIVANSRDVTEKIEIEKELKEGKERLELLMKAGSESIWDYDITKNELFLGEGYQKKYGLESSKKISNLELHDALVHPEDFESFKSGITKAFANPKITEWQESYRFRKKNGDYVRVQDRAIILRDEKGKAIRAIGAIKDVNQQFLSNKLDEIEKVLMEASIKAEMPLQKLLKNYLSGIDSLFQGMKCSISSIEQGRLRNLISPGLPKEYLDDIEGLPIGLNQGSCGTAAFLKKQIVAKDIFSDERWASFTHLAKNYGFKSCWSEPIFNEKGNVIATFAIYHEEVKGHEDLEINIFERAARLISVILQNFAYIKNIKESNERFTYINKATNNAIYDWDINSDHFYWGNSLTRVFGHNINENKFSLRDWTQWIHPDDLDEILQNLDMLLANPQESKWSYEYRFKDINGQYAFVEDIGYLIRDENGQPLRMIGALRDQTQYKQEQIKQELQYNLSQFFKMEDSLDQILNKSIKYLSEFGSYSAGEIWLLSHDKQILHLSACYAKSGDKEVFYKENVLKTIQLGEGLPGSVWKTLKNEVWNDINKTSKFERSSLAEKATIKSAAAYPFFYREKIIGVMVLFSDYELKEHDHNVTYYNNLKHYLGAEIMRKQQEEELNLFFNSAPDILAIASPDGYFVKVNPAFCELLGYAEDELTSTPFSDYIHPDYLKSTTLEFGETISGDRKSSGFINRYRTKNGNYKWISWNSSDVFGQEGFVFSYGRDVTEMLEMQQTVKNATKLARVGGWEINQLTGEHSWSPMTKEIHEVPHDFNPSLAEAINFYHPDYQEKVSEAVEKAIETGGPFDFEAIIITLKGNERWVRAIGNAELRNGECIRIYGSFQDINDKKNAEIRLQKISNNIPGVIFQYHLKPDGTDFMKFISEGSKEVWGFDSKDVLENNQLVWNRIEAGGEIDKVQKSIMESAENLTRWRAKWRYIMPNGLVKYHEGFGNPDVLADGTIIWNSIITDITDLFDLEKMAERTSKFAKIGSWELSLSDDLKEDRLFWSPTTRQILEVDDDYKPSFSSAFEFYFQKDKRFIEKAIHKLIHEGEEFDFEVPIKTHRGNKKWNRCIGHGDRVNGKTLRIYGSYQDIDKQKRTELAVQDALTEKEDILESIGDAFFAVDKNWIVTYWNKEAEKLLGKKREEILSKNLWEEYEAAISLKFYEEYHKAVNTQETVHFEEYFPPIDKWFEVSAYPSDKGLSVYFKDITLRKTAEEKIRASNDRFEKVALATNDSIWDWDLVSGSVTRSGSGFENQFGYTISEANQDIHFWKNNVHPEDLEAILKTQQIILKDKNSNFWTGQYRFKKKSGEYAYVIDKGLIVRNEKGKAIRMIGATTDITARKRYEESLLEINDRLIKQTQELAHSNAELEQFAYVASHDLQEPLRMVSGFLTQLEKKYGDQLDEKANQYINFAVDGAKRMRQIILDLLDYSKIGKKEEEIVSVDLNEVLYEVCLLQRKQIEELNAKVEFKDLPIIFGHPSPMIQVFSNLISNSLKYSHHELPPKIIIKAAELKNEWKFSLKDNGIGIEEEYYEKIFNIFSTATQQK
ncbi:PAS domain-containing protein [Marivirga sp.]|uniref:PAS domain-containing protein n=1 Tax=Marivirga sp. TaxID=2018662 RepID=UPI002D7F7EA4|nr:PAS domain-containing protein [Marivirga sp.]HET8861077.1 PAS domain-containing protein [Marivirga sp.]